MTDVLNFLSENTFYIATIENDQPRVRPFGAVCEFEGKLYIVTNNQKPVFAQLLANPKTEICAMDKEGKWLRVEGKAFLDQRIEAREKMLAVNPSLTRMYKADDGLMEVLYLTDVTATFSSFTSEPKVIKF